LETIVEHANQCLYWSAALKCYFLS